MQLRGYRQELAHELAVISQLVYKHCSAHRGTKYFQALKKVDRHMCEFSRLKVFQIASFDRGKNAETRKRRAVALLSEVERNSVEVVQRCLPELALCHFITLHSLVVATISKLFAHIKFIKAEIQESLGSQSTSNRQLTPRDRGSRCGPMYGVHRTEDVGVKIPRHKVANLKPIVTRNANTHHDGTTTGQLDLGVPISRKSLERESAVTQCSHSGNNNKYESTKLILSNGSTKIQKIPGASMENAAKDKKHANAVKGVVSGNAKESHRTSIDTMNIKSDVALFYDDSKTTLRDAGYQTWQERTDASIGKIRKKKMHVKICKSKRNRYTNKPLHSKRYHVRFLLHCNRKKHALD